MLDQPFGDAPGVKHLPGDGGGRTCTGAVEMVSNHQPRRSEAWLVSLGIIRASISTNRSFYSIAITTTCRPCLANATGSVRARPILRPQYSEPLARLLR